MSTRTSSEALTSSADAGNSSALDQWRGLALVLVLISHGFFFTDRVPGLGRVGVNLFFFISGVLVFRSLAKTRADAWTLASGFWRRRLKRLYPALAAYLVAMLPVAFLLQSQPGLPRYSDFTTYWHGAPFALAYAVNYWPPVTSMSLGHLWSLACEMQFYLLAPIIFLFGGKAASRRFFVWGIFLATLVAVGFIGPFYDPEGKYKYHFEQAVWPMMLGFCCEHRKDWFQRLPAAWARPIVNMSLLALAAGVVFTLFGWPVKKLVIAGGSLAVLPCFIAYVTGCPLPGTGGRVLAWIGERTYSIYLWQQPLTLCGYLPAILHPVGAAGAVLVGGLWFRWFEQPFLSAGRQHDSPGGSAPRERSGAARLWLLLGLLIAVVAVGMILRQRYAEKLMAQVWPSGVQFAWPTAGTNSSATNTVLLLGDSRIAEWGRPRLDDRRVLNAGTMGLTSAQLALRCRAALDKTRPQWVVIQIGINDLKLLGVRPELREAVVSGCVSNIQFVVAECRRRGARVVLTPVWPAGAPGLARRLVWSDDVNAAVRETNARLENKFPGDADVRVADIFSSAAAGLSDQQRTRLYRDTLHLRPETYAPLSARLAEAVTAWANAPAPASLTPR